MSNLMVSKVQVKHVNAWLIKEGYDNVYFSGSEMSELYKENKWGSLPIDTYIWELKKAHHVYVPNDNVISLVSFINNNAHRLLINESIYMDTYLTESKMQEKNLNYQKYMINNVEDYSDYIVNKYKEDIEWYTEKKERKQKLLTTEMSNNDKKLLEFSIEVLDNQISVYTNAEKEIKEYIAKNKPKQSGE